MGPNIEANVNKEVVKDGGDGIPTGISAESVDGVEPKEVVEQPVDDGQPQDEVVDGQPSDENQTPPAEPEYVLDLRRQLEDLKEKMTPKPDVNQPPVNEPPKEITPQEWEKIHQDWGFTKQTDKDTGESYEAIDKTKLIRSVGQALMRVRQDAVRDAEEMILKHMWPIQKDAIMGQLAKKFPDARNYSQAVEDFITKRYKPMDRLNIENWEEGLMMARGRGLKDAVRKAVDAKDKNRVIVRPTNGGGSQGKPSSVLTKEQEEMYQKGGGDAFFGSRKEYLAMMK